MRKVVTMAAVGFAVAMLIPSVAAGAENKNPQSWRFYGSGLTTLTFNDFTFSSGTIAGEWRGNQSHIGRIWTRTTGTFTSTGSGTASQGTYTKVVPEGQPGCSPSTPSECTSNELNKAFAGTSWPAEVNGVPGLQPGEAEGTIAIQVGGDGKFEPLNHLADLCSGSVASPCITIFQRNVPVSFNPLARTLVTRQEFFYPYRQP